MTNDLYNGREAEVIAQFNDGYSYSKTKLDASLREVLTQASDRKAIKPVKNNAQFADNVKSIMETFEISKAQAEKALTENDGDREKTVRALVSWQS
ncbi:hypothetical protein HYDPIDRAFT_36295 [Hydnomerulius pinastri MD-312]|nr:hypothetical protein HYDPIDRAFT_36295 [Hydnomerulius pinastri MD-312]